MSRRWMMIVAAAGLAAACQQRPEAPLSGMRTVDNVPAAPIAIEQPPVIGTAGEGAEAMTSTAQPAPGAQTPKGGLTPDESVRAKTNLPYAPSIAMDPVDGGKVSIRPDTPIAQYRNQLYYFTSDANRRAFVAEPEKYLKGGLGRY